MTEKYQSYIKARDGLIDSLGSSTTLSSDKVLPAINAFFDRGQEANPNTLLNTVGRGAALAGGAVIGIPLAAAKDIVGLSGAIVSRMMR